MDFKMDIKKNRAQVHRECEIKYEIDDKEEKELIRYFLSQGFIFTGEYLETDFCPDTRTKLIKKENMVLRLRFTEGTKSDVLLTLKIKGDDTRFQDNTEIEFWLSQIDKSKFELINQVLKEKVNIILPTKLLSVKSVGEAKNVLYRIGLGCCRMLSQKKRKNYEKNGIKLSFDLLPKDYGHFMEVESKIPEMLFDFVGNCKVLQGKEVVRKNYGKLIQEKNALHLPENTERVCLFRN